MWANRSVLIPSQTDKWYQHVLNWYPSDCIDLSVLYQYNEYHFENTLLEQYEGQMKIGKLHCQL